MSMVKDIRSPKLLKIKTKNGKEFGFFVESFNCENNENVNEIVMRVNLITNIKHNDEVIDVIESLQDHIFVCNKNDDL